MIGWLPSPRPRAVCACATHIYVHGPMDLLEATHDETVAAIGVRLWDQGAFKRQG